MNARAAQNDFDPTPGYFRCRKPLARLKPKRLSKTQQQAMTARRHHTAGGYRFARSAGQAGSYPCVPPEVDRFTINADLLLTTAIAKGQTAALFHLIQLLLQLVPLHGLSLLLRTSVQCQPARYRPVRWPRRWSPPHLLRPVNALLTAGVARSIQCCLPPAAAKGRDTQTHIP